MKINLQNKIVIALFSFLSLFFVTQANASGKLIDVYQFKTNWFSSILNVSSESCSFYCSIDGGYFSGDGEVNQLYYGGHPWKSAMYNFSVVNNSFSYSYWFKTDNTGGTYYNYILDSNNIQIGRIDYRLTKNDIGADIGGGGFTSTQYYFDPPVDTNWHFYSYSFSDTVLSIYIDGVKYFDGILIHPLSLENFNFGQLQLDQSYSGSNLRHSDIAFYNEALTDTEVLGIYNLGSSVFNYSFPVVIPPSGGGITIYDPQQVEGLYFRFDNILNYCRVDMSCSIGYSFDQNIFGANATGTLLYYQTSTSTPQNLGVISLNTQKQLGIFGSGNIIATSSASSTAFSYYAIVPHSDIWSQDYATTSAAIWFLDAAQAQRVFDDPWNAANTPNPLGIDTHKLACTDEQWASTSSIPFLGVNVDRIICNSRQWLLDTGMTPMQFMLNKATSIKDKILSMFPFNLIIKMQNDWKTESQILTSFLITPCYAADGEFSTSTAVYTGDFSITAGNLFGAGTGTTSINFLSKDNLTGMYGESGFDTFNLICRVLVWLAFFAYCWNLITDRLHKEMTN